MREIVQQALVIVVVLQALAITILIQTPTKAKECLPVITKALSEKAELQKALSVSLSESQQQDWLSEVTKKK